MGPDDVNVLDTVAKTRLGPQDIVVVRFREGADVTPQLMHQTDVMARNVIRITRPEWNGAVIVLPPHLDLYVLGDDEAARLHAELGRRLGKTGG